MSIGDSIANGASPQQVDGSSHSKQTNGYPHALPERQPNGVGVGPQVLSTSDKIETLCGPLLNYKRMSDGGTPSARWYGSVLIVTKPGQRDPKLILRPIQDRQQRPSTIQRPPSAFDNFVDAPETSQPGPISPPQPQGSFAQEEPDQATQFHAEKLYEDPNVEFWRFNIDLPLAPTACQWQYHIPRVEYSSGASAEHLATRVFHVPAYTESMRIMFHSCNGFSVGTDEDAWSGCALWNDVMRQHAENPIHVMIGGGDQIYNDGIRVSGPLREWCDMRNPLDRQKYPFTEDLRARCDEYYLNNYIKWYATEPFASANGQIAQINIWDDHDIIDGFGSYVDRFMKCAVFRGIGGVAHKYYMLFQHHVPPASTFTTDAPQTTTTAADDRTDPKQLQATYVMTEKVAESHYLIASQPGPYVQEHSRSIYTELGAHIALLGIDARTERTRRQVNYDETYDFLFNHTLEQIKATAGRIKHFILLLGIPIAYPRMQWLENIFSSPVMGVVRFANKRFGFAGGLFNNFDGSIDLMDDLDDHYTAHQHKKERKELILRLQKVAKECNVRVTILGGDVHLAAHGRFYSNPGLGIPAENDHRYMPNIISSAITNHPPPQAVANLLAKRNKIHHLDHETDETLLYLFDHDPGRVPGHEEHDEKGQLIKAHSAASNHCTMPSRNYALLALSNPSIEHVNGAPNGSANGTTNRTVNGTADGSADGATNGAVNGTPDGATNGNADQPLSAELDGKFDLAERKHHNLSRKSGNPRLAQHAGEDGCGTAHLAASGSTPSGLGGAWGLDVTYRVEINEHDREGRTQGYGLTIPGLHVRDNEKHEGEVARGLDKAKDAGREVGQKV
ncbi:MAG: hypothetical protein Q9159_003300 [Coniocarpon cinnabarinum]